MPDLINVKGLSELEKFMDQLPIKVERNVARGAVRAGMNVVKPVAQANVHSVSGKLALGLKITTRSKGGMVVAKLKATGPHASIAHLIEFTGAKAHLISAATKKALSIGGQAFASVHHPGFKPRPFMRPALDTEASAAVVAVGNYIKDRLATREGLDTSAVLVEGDEA